MRSDYSRRSLRELERKVLGDGSHRRADRARGARRRRVRELGSRILPHGGAAIAISVIAALLTGCLAIGAAPGGVKGKPSGPKSPPPATTTTSASTTTTRSTTTTATTSTSTTTTTTVAPATTSPTTTAPTVPSGTGGPAFIACGPNRDPSMTSPYTTFAAAETAFPNTTYVDVPTGDNSSVLGANWMISANTTYWFEPGVHKIGTSQYAQISPANNDAFIGAPGAVIDGQGLNNYAFSQQAANVTIEYLEVTGFMSPGPEGVINHDFGDNWVMKYNYAHNNHGAAMFVGKNNVASYNCLDHNGAYGFQGGESNITLSYNEISNNDADNLQVTDPSCGCQGGGKFWDTHGATVTYNYVHDNKSVGLWADTNNVNFDISHNYIADNADEAIIYETSYNFRISYNTFVRNNWVHGASNHGFPNPAVYISESGGDSRLGTFAASEVAHNTFTDNWGGVTLWENADRYCGSGANTSTGYCTLVNPTVASTSTCTNASLIGTTPYIDDCRWKTKNVAVHDNVFALTQANVPGCTHAATCGYNALVSQWGSNMGNGDPYQGTFVEDNITYNQNNGFSSNTYTGYWAFQIHEQNNVVSWSTWRASPFNKDAGSTMG